MAIGSNTKPALDTAYMQVPSCATCQHWKRGEGSAWGECHGMDELVASPWSPYAGGLDTRADFGCVQHQERASAAVAAPETTIVDEATA